MSQSRGVDALPSLAQPAISPDGKSIAFLSGGNLWEVSADGGDAHLLVSSAGDVSRPLYSPDGKQLAFVSTRTGNGDIYLISLETGQLKRLTTDDAADNLDAWSPDGRWIYFSTTGHDIGVGMQDIYRVAAAGGTPMPVVNETYVNEFEAAPAPDGHTLVFAENGMAARQWWRNGHSHLDECELWETDLNAPGHYFPLTAPGSKNQWPMFSSSGETVYFMSDRDGSQNLWSVAAGALHGPDSLDNNAVTPARQLTHFHDDRVIWPTLSANGKTIVFERAFGIWKYDIAGGQAAPLTIHLRGTVAGPTVEHTNYNTGFWELAVSHDGRKLAVVARGQIYACTTTGGQAVRVTHTDAMETGITWAHDDKRIAYVSTRDGIRHLYCYDFATKTETRLTGTSLNDTLPVFSPDDSQIAFVRDFRELRSVDAKGKNDHVIARGLPFERPPFDVSTSPIAWSPAGDWIACVSAGAKGFHNLFLTPSAADSSPRQVSFLANVQSNSVAWAPDSSALFFGSGQRTEDFQLARVDLTQRSPKFHDDQFNDLFKDHPNRAIPQRSPRQPGIRPGIPADAPAEPATQPALSTSRPATRPLTNITFEGIDQRLSLLPVGLNVENLTVSPDGKAVAFIGESANKRNLYLFPLDPLQANPVARQLTATAGDKEFAQFAPDPVNTGTLRLWFLEDAAVKYVTLSSAPNDTVQFVPVATEMDVDFDRDKLVMFDEAWRTLAENFPDPKMNGIDWRAVRGRYAPQIAGAKTFAEVRRLLSLMVGELNASHLHVDGPQNYTLAIGSLCANFDRTAYEDNGLLKISSVVPFGPAALSGLTPDEYILSVEGTPITRETNLNTLLEHKADKDITLSVAAKPDGSDRHDVKVQTTNLGNERTLRYRAWVANNRNYVTSKSHGRLGYVHLADMSQQELVRLYTDLDARNETLDGVIIDVRNNTGGFVNGYAIDVFARKNYINLQARGFPKTTGRAALGQRFLGLPTILVTNRGTLSDGESFTEGYQSLELGDTVGEPTGGWIIFTSTIKLLDGSSFGSPVESVYASDGTPMEMHPRPVTFAVSHPAGESFTNTDSQLDTAVKELLAKVDKK